jgi:hypothetical protein
VVTVGIEAGGRGNAAAVGTGSTFVNIVMRNLHRSLPTWPGVLEHRLMEASL